MHHHSISDRRIRVPPKKTKHQRKEREIPAKLISLISVFTVIAITVAGVYVRLQPALDHDFELQGDDSWEVYWVSKYLVEKGITAWFKLDRSNPDTHVFWYPWGQDFKHVDYPFLHMFNAATYPIASLLGLSVKQWVAVTPALFGGLMIITGFLLVRRLAGEIPGILAALFLALAPGTIERTVSTFAEKQGLAIPLMFLSFYFLDRALEKKSIIEAAVLGVIIGLIGWTWGGYQAIYLIFALSLAVSPAFYRYTFKQGSSVFLSTVIGALLALGNTTIPLRELYSGAVGVLLLSGALVLFASAIYDSKIKLAFLSTTDPVKLYRIMLLAVMALGLIMFFTGNMPVGGRALALLRGETDDPLGASVAEHQPQSLAEVARKTGVMIILGPAYIPVGLYYGRRNAVFLSLALAAVISLVVIFNAAYLTQFSASILAVSSGLALAPLSRRAIGKASFRLTGQYFLALSVIALVLIASFLPTVRAGVQYADALIPSPKTGMVGISVENRAWYYALDYIRDQLPEGSLIVSWWDYGYIITSYTGKATVADGATSNGTQIKLLARALTAPNESEACRIIFNDFKAPPDKTYLLIFDVFQSIKLNESSNVWYTAPLLNPYTGTVGMGDIPKSVWMLRIAGRMGLKEISPYFAVRQIQFTTGRTVPVLGPDWLNENVSSTMIYRLFINGVYSLNQTAQGPLDLSGEHYFIDPIDIYLGTPNPVPKVPLERIAPLKVFVDPIYDSPTNKLYVAVFLFKLS